MEDSVEKEESGISPGVVFLIALFSIGGLLFVGWVGSKADITGDVIRGQYNACCTVEPWDLSMAGYRQGTGVGSTAVCDASELPNQCCVRAGKDLFRSPVKLIYSIAGACREGGPAVNYPSYFSYPISTEKGYTACCTTSAWRNTQVGFTEASADKTTTQCSSFESLQTCCSRVATRHVGSPVNVIDTGYGACPQISYPAGEYTACCTIEVRSGAPSGTIRLPGQTTTETCSAFESMRDCCSRAGVERTLSANVRFIGAAQGACVKPEKSYPTAVSGYPICCTLETWQQSPIGYTQGTAKTTTESCTEGENPNMCCFRAGSERYGYAVKLLGLKQGGCSSPQQNFPLWIR